MALASSTCPSCATRRSRRSVPRELRDPQRSIFDVIRERDLLVHHPFDSFSATVEQFLESAATDEHVLAIKLTLYRTSGDTAIVRALTEAASAASRSRCSSSCKARFDEANNITWARTLEDFGVHVAYGSAGLKTHAKTALVVRREPDGIRRYVHIGTGNYNSKTARLYTDVGLFTVQPVDRRRRERPVQLAHRLLAAAAVPQAARRAGEHARAVPRADRARGRARARGARGAHHREDERARRPGR